MRELSYFTSVFLVVRLFLWYQTQGHLPWSRSNSKVSLLKKGGLGGISASQTHLSPQNFLRFSTRFPKSDFLRMVKTQDGIVES